MVAPSSWRSSARKRAEAVAIAAVAVPIIGGLGRTWRWRIEGRETLEALEQSGRPPILALWHGRILSATVLLRDKGIVALASDNFDGEWIARVLSRFGYGIARGSSSRGGARALVRLRKAVASGKTTAFTVDGPRGPVYHVHPGCLWLAKATGSAILPFHIEAQSCWTASSWDRAQIPKPLSRVVACFGEPFVVAPHVTDEMLEQRRQALELAMVALMHRTAGLARQTS